MFEGGCEDAGDSEALAYWTVFGISSTTATGGSVISPFYDEVSINTSKYRYDPLTSSR